MATYDALLAPFSIKNVVFRNRLISTSHSPGYGEQGMPKDRYQLYHEEKAKGGVALTMFGGSSAVSIDSPTGDWGLLYLGDDRIVPYFEEFSKRIHQHGAKLMCQVTHQGRRNRWDTDNWLPIISSSNVAEPQHNFMPKEMEDWDIRRVIDDFAKAARRCKEGGLDGIELNAPGPHLISQFISPSVNCRTDEYGGDLINRMRFGLEVIDAVRAEVGDDFIVGFRMSGDELIEGGLSQDDCVDVARHLAATGNIDFLTVNGASSRDHRSSALHVPGMALPVSPFLYLASKIKTEVEIPVFHAQRQTDPATAARAVADGHVDMVGMTRPHFTDPHIMKKISEGREDEIRQCVGAGFCIDRLFSGKESLCIHNAATGREKDMPHVIPRATERRKVVVVGGGPGGMEAARVAVERGHDVTLFEARDALGGQINIAAKATWRGALEGIVRWFDIILRKRGVEIRLETLADIEAVRALGPDVVIIATGGKPCLGHFEGSDLAVSTWDVLTGKIPLGENILVYDFAAREHAISAAETASVKGSQVEIVSHERMIARMVGATNFTFHLREIYDNEVILTPDHVISRIYKEEKSLIAVLRNEYTLKEEEREVDQIIADYGTIPDDELYKTLKPLSINQGEIDLPALVQGLPQCVVRNSEGEFQLYRVGDAISGRNVHAAIYDALRLLKDI